MQKHSDLSANDVIEIVNYFEAADMSRFSWVPVCCGAIGGLWWQWLDLFHQIYELLDILDGLEDVLGIIDLSSIIFIALIAIDVNTWCRGGPAFNSGFVGSSSNSEVSPVAPAASPGVLYRPILHPSWSAAAVRGATSAGVVRPPISNHGDSMASALGGRGSHSPDMVLINAGAAVPREVTVDVEGDAEGSHVVEVVLVLRFPISPGGYVVPSSDLHSLEVVDSGVLREAGCCGVLPVVPTVWALSSPLVLANVLMMRSIPVPKSGGTPVAAGATVHLIHSSLAVTGLASVLVVVCAGLFQFVIISETNSVGRILRCNLSAREILFLHDTEILKDFIAISHPSTVASGFLRVAREDGLHRRLPWVQPVRTSDNIVI